MIFKIKNINFEQPNFKRKDSNMKNQIIDIEKDELMQPLKERQVSRIQCKIDEITNALKLDLLFLFLDEVGDADHIQRPKGLGIRLIYLGECIYVETGNKPLNKETISELNFKLNQELIKVHIKKGLV